MMKQPEIIYSGTTSILYLDFSGLKTKEEIVKQIEVFRTYIKKQPLNSLYTLTNLENMYFNTEVYNAISVYAKANNAYVKASAVIGLKGMMQIFYKGFAKLSGRNVKVCSSKDEAIASLVQQEAIAV